MKYSIYNTNFEHKNRFYIHNSLTNTLSEINENLNDFLLGSLNKDINIQDYLPDVILADLIKKKVIVDADEYELLKIRNQVELYRKTGEKVHLTIAPTMDCDFDCYYCFESNRGKLKISEDTQNDIIEYLKIIPNLNNLHIAWFGGEPLLAMNEIKSITKKIKDLPVIYSANIVTNGYNLDNFLFDEFLDLKIKSIQITIDGPKEIHDKRRTHKLHRESFDKIVSNVNEFAKQSKNRDNEIDIIFRVNIDHENMESFGILYEYLKKNIIYSNYSISYGWIKYTTDRKVESYCITRPDVIDFIEKFGENEAIKSLIYPRNEILECFARSYWGIVIDPIGDVYKWWEEIGNKSDSLGHISDLGFLSSERQLAYMYQTDHYTYKGCNNCKIKPICNACPKEFLSKSDFGRCPDIKYNLNDYLKIYVDNQNG